MDFRLLGPLEVASGRAVVPIGGTKERTVLALLLLRANRLVSRDRLVDELWSGRPPPTARHTLEAYISRLRRALSAHGRGAPIESLPGGYRMHLDANELDSLRFEQQLEAGRSALEQGELPEAEASLAEALGLWRGEMLADLDLPPLAAGEVGRLEELHLAATEAYGTAALALGHQARVADELPGLVAQHPYREELRRQLMLALYRCGRQAEALDLFLEGRQRLVDELGIEPGGELQELQAAILRHDAELDRCPAEATGAPSVPPRERPGLDSANARDPAQPGVARCAKTRFSSVHAAPTRTRTTTVK